MGSPETWPVCICGHSRTRHSRRVMPGCVSIYGECVGFGPDFKRCECPTYCHDGATPTPPAPADETAWLLETADQSHLYLVEGRPGHPAHMTSDPWKATRFKTREAAALKFAMIGTGTLAALGIPNDLRPVEHGFAQPAPADDASGAEAAACVAPAHDMAPRVVVEPYGTSCWQVWLHIGTASWTVGNYRRDKDAAERFAEPLRHALYAAPLPARDDAVEEAMVPGCHEHVALWDAINAYSVACGGHPTRGGGARMDAVVRVEKALRAALRRAKGGA